MAEENEKLEEFKVAFKNGALKNLERLSGRFNADGDLEKVVEKAVKLLTYVQNARGGKVLWNDDTGATYFVEIDKL